MADPTPAPASAAAPASASDALVHSPALLDGIVQLAADGIISVDEEERIHLFNRGAEEIFGYSADEVIGPKLELLIPERYREQHHAEHLPHVFDRFWQARGTRRGGAGLGLAIVKGIVEAHGGTLGVASAPDAGATFWFEIPTTS